MTHRKKIFFVLLSLVLIACIAAPLISQAKALEIKYPKIPGIAKVPNSRSTVPEYLAYLYYFSIDIVGVIAFVILVIGGIQYLTAAGSVTKTKAATKTMIGGGTGILIILGAFLALRTINPQLVGLKTTKLIPLHGVCLYAHKGEENEEQHCYVENMTSLPNDFHPDTIALYGLQNEFFQVFLFPEDKYQGQLSSILNYRQKYKDDPQIVNISNNVSSLYFDNHQSGVFLFPNEVADYDDDSFKNYPHNLPMVINSSIDDLKNFNDRTKSLLFRYSYDNYDFSHNPSVPTDDLAYPDVFFGAVLHSGTNGTGQCSLVYKRGFLFGSEGWSRGLKLSEVDLHPIANVRSIDVFNQIGRATCRERV